MRNSSIFLEAEKLWKGLGPNAQEKSYGSGSLVGTPSLIRVPDESRSQMMPIYKKTAFSDEFSALPDSQV